MDSATYNFNCPHCGQQIAGNPSHAGTAVNCPNCGQEFSVPAPSAAARRGGNPLAVPLAAVSVLLVAALGAAGFIWSNGQHGGTPSGSASNATAITSSGAPDAIVKSAEPTSFAEVAKHLDAGGSFYGYLDTAQFMSGITKQINLIRDVLAMAPDTSNDPNARASMNMAFTVVDDLIKKSGLQEISGLGASSIAIEPGVYQNKIFIHQGSSANNGFIWTAFGKSAHHLDALDFLPADTALANSSDLDLSNLVDGLRQEVVLSGMPNGKQTFDAGLAQLSATFGMPLEEVLESLDGSVDVILTLNPQKQVTVPVGDKPLNIPTPRFAILLKVKNDRLFNQVDKTLGANPGVVHKDDSDLKLRTLPIPTPMQDWLKPSLAQWSKGYLIIATDDSIITDIVAAQKTGKGLKSTTQFTSLIAGLPQDGNGFQLVTQLFAETFAKLQREAIASQPGSTPEQMAMFQKLFASQKPSSVYSVSTHLPDGWLIVGKGTHGASQVVGPLMVAPAAILAGIALPVFSQVQVKGKETKSMSNAKQIAVACKLYAIDNSGKFPPTLQALIPDYVPTNDLFHSPFKPEDQQGYIYTPGLSDTSDASLVLVEDKFSPESAHARVVAHVDCSAIVLKASRTP